MDDLQAKTVVITGASSGMGLAAALAFAHRGANLILAARREEPLRQAVRACEARGARAVWVHADVTDPAQMRALARSAVEAFGSIDVWINNAGLSLWGRFADISINAQIRLVEVNLLGVMNGTHAALPPMLSRGRGVIINMASIGGRVPIPFAAAYSASKFGVKGFTEALRYELAAETDIAVCGVYPGFVDTPTNIHSANYTGRSLRPVPPVIDPNRVAEALVRLAQHPRRALHLGLHHALAGPYGVCPDTTGRVMGHLSRKFFLESGPPAQSFDGTLFEPVQEGVSVRGGWGGPERRSAGQATLAAVVGIAGVALLTSALAARRKAGVRGYGLPKSSA